jgi:hypothetical protein
VDKITFVAILFWLIPALLGIGLAVAFVLK